jgi:NADH dehydrogenase (ubiquinone) 1 alpha subcomplex subunit 5
VEALTKHRLQLVQSTDSISQIESSLNAGKIEEVIIQAQDELSLLESMKEKRPWEPLEVPVPPNQWKYFDKQ